MTDPSTAADEHLDAALRPRARDWFWHPWYAKLWWGVAGMIWIASLSQISQEFVNDHPLILTMALFIGSPCTLITSLGFGYIRQAWNFNQGRRRNYLNECSHELIGRNHVVLPIKGGRDFENPSDPRYFWYPSNPMSEEYQRRLHGKN